jgi:hypothetical protein
VNKQRNLQGNEAKVHSGKMAGAGGPAHGSHQLSKKSGQPKMAAHGPQTGGNRGPATGKQQGKKKQGKPEQPHGHH